MDSELRNRIPLGPTDLKAFMQEAERSNYDARTEFFGLNFSASRVLSNFSWDLYSYNAYLAYIRAKAPTGKPPVSETGLCVGRLSPELTQLLQDIFASCEEQPLDPFAFRSGYLFEPRQGVHESMSRINRYFVPSAKFHADFPTILQALAPEIERVSGHFWRACATRIFSVRPVPETHSFHFDGWPLAIKKLYFYPNGVDRELGSTEMVDKKGRELIVEGGPGTWALFENSQVKHQALPNATKERPTIEITVAPSFQTDTTIVEAGTNGMFPFYPFDAGGPDESLLPDEFRFAEIEHRALRRTAGLAVALPMGDHSLGVDPYIGIDLEPEAPPRRSLLQRLGAWLAR